MLIGYRWFDQHKLEVAYGTNFERVLFLVGLPAASVAVSVTLDDTRRFALSAFLARMNPRLLSRNRSRTRASAGADRLPAISLVRAALAPFWENVSMPVARMTQSSRHVARITT